MKLKPNAIGRFGIPSLQIDFGAQKLKPKFSVRCKNCIQHQPNQTDYAPSYKALSLIAHFQIVTILRILH